MRAGLLRNKAVRRTGCWVGFVGNFWFWKRPDLFLQICSRLLQARSHCHFVVFGRSGDWTEHDLIRIAQDLGIADRITFAGFHLPGERNIAALDLLIATSVHEPFGRTLVEAAIVGTPYVATDDAGYREIWNTWRGGCLVLVTATADQNPLRSHSTFRACLKMSFSEAKSATGSPRTPRQVRTRFRSWKSTIAFGLLSVIPWEIVERRGSKRISRNRRSVLGDAPAKRGGIGWDLKVGPLLGPML